MDYLCLERDKGFIQQVVDEFEKNNPTHSGLAEDIAGDARKGTKSGSVTVNLIAGDTRVASLLRTGRLEGQEAPST